jgi:hypothetical protein
MDAFDRTLEALLVMARANRPDSILPVNQAIDRFIAEGPAAPAARIAALARMEEAFERAAPRNELACYARLVLGQRRRLQSLADPGPS